MSKFEERLKDGFFRFMAVSHTFMLKVRKYLPKLPSFLEFARKETRWSPIRWFLIVMAYIVVTVFIPINSIVDLVLFLTLIWFQLLDSYSDSLCFPKKQ